MDTNATKPEQLINKYYLIITNIFIMSSTVQCGILCPWCSQISVLCWQEWNLMWCSAVIAQSQQDLKCSEMFCFSAHHSCKECLFDFQSTQTSLVICHWSLSLTRCSSLQTLDTWCFSVFSVFPQFPSVNSRWLCIKNAGIQQFLKYTHWVMCMGKPVHLVQPCQGICSYSHRDHTFPHTNVWREHFL